MQGAYINMTRPKTKKSLREAVVAGTAVTLEATSMFGNEYGGPLDTAPDGAYYVVGPDPYTDRRWYATIKVANGTAKVS